MIYSNSQSQHVKRKKVRIQDFFEKKSAGKKVTSITCYDATFAKIIEATDIDFVLVGDSLGNVIQGKNSTIPVTLEEIAYHVRAVRQSLKTPLLVADMPFLTAGVSRQETIHHAGLLMQAGAEAVKIEGATPEICDQIQFLTAHGVPVMGHIGLTPQSVHTLGGYRIQGKTEHDKQRLLQEAKRLEDCGCFAIVLELTVAEVAKEVSQTLTVPTIGIGSGNYCDGNILVLYDMLGLNQQFKPKFLKHYLNLEENIQTAINEYCKEVIDYTSENE
ncbi:3-methyl-2-oxobutanoate hydroxymethyltransferase [Spirobacillus cienkowskii]|uniref:3-methyl-2-oxobutanoate hydroxymethyltransferase n=1 Tax=Spirobacillus cienkowskii TaxID=495820 RepID=UPI0030CC0FE3